MALTDKLTAIADAIRTKTGSSDSLTLDQMPTAIEGIVGGEFTIPTITGNATQRFSHNGWNWTFNYGITTADLSNTNSMFYNSSAITSIPFDINYTANASGHDINYMFTGCQNLLSVPKLIGCKPTGMDQLFISCAQLRKVPDDFDSWFDWTYVETAGNYTSMGSMFNSCHALTSFPTEIFKHQAKRSDIQTYESGYAGLGYYNYCLDEIVNLPVYDKVEWTENAFQSNAFDHCMRLKAFTFEKNEDGTAKTAKWANQVIDLHNYVGWGDYSYNFTNYGMSYYDQFSNQHDELAEVEAARHKSGAWSLLFSQSRYAAPEAQATLDSLPDTSAFVTDDTKNIIKFRKEAGVFSSTGKMTSISNVSVANRKGWKVILVDSSGNEEEI